VSALRVALIAGTLAFVIGLLLFSPLDAPPRPVPIEAAKRVHVTAQVRGDNCLGRPGGHFVLCRQEITYTTDDGREYSGSVTVTEEALKRQGGLTLSVEYDRENPEMVRARESPGTVWYWLFAWLRIGLILIAATGVGLICAMIGSEWRSSRRRSTGGAAS